MKVPLLLSLICLSPLPACPARKIDPKIVTVEPLVDGAALADQKDAVDADKTLDSVRELGSLYVMTVYGDYTRQVERFHDQVVKSVATRSMLGLDRLCSLFSYYGDADRPVFGRNFDNIHTDLLVCYYFPDGGYASIAFTPLSEMGFKDGAKPNLQSSLHRFKLLNAPCLTIEGMNEKGVALALASVDARAYTPEEGKEPKFIIHLVREILDHAASVDEAVERALRYNLFDNGLNLLSHHLMVAGPDRSVLLEHDGKGLRVIEMDGLFQAATNHRLYGLSPQGSRGICSRFKTAWDALEDLDEPLSWQGAMEILSRVKQVDHPYDLGGGRRIVANTIWSAVFDLKGKAIYLCMNMDYDKVYRLPLRDRAYYLNKEKEETR